MLSLKSDKKHAISIVVYMLAIDNNRGRKEGKKGRRREEERRKKLKASRLEDKSEIVFKTDKIVLHIEYIKGIFFKI